MRIGLIADTHIPSRAKAIPEEVLQAFQQVDLILHAGDLVVQYVLDQLREVAPVQAVIGNNDPAALGLPMTRELQVMGFRIGLTHGHVGVGKSTVERVVSRFPGFDCVVFGHSHIAVCERRDGMLIVNPGSATDRRRSTSCSYGFLDIGPSGIEGQIVYLPGPAAKDSRK